MTTNAIEVSNLSKMFKLYPSQGKRLLDYVTFGKKKYYQEFWALQNISFNVPKGSTFGILGQNGSGKSTLLSILAGVLEPSSGFFRVNGKVSAILELGAGFHPEFSGRANVYMYGSIMGLTKEETDERMPDIIHFSELGDFIDQPLRTYSSGMYARLAFSVAVNVDADVLIVDEALAVGDALFQHRCFRKIHEMKEAGRTILYVGHDTGAVRSLCDHAMILDHGKILSIGDSSQMSNEYLVLIAERQQKYYEDNLCEYGEKPDEKWHQVFNFIDNLNKARKKVTQADSVREIKIELKSVMKRSVFAHPPSEISYSTIIPNNCVLSFAIGIYPSAYELIKNSVKFSIIIEHGSDKHQLFSKTLNPQKKPEDKGFFNQIINLNEFGGEKISITFITEGSEADVSYCWAGWGWPSLYIQKENPPKLLREKNIDNTNSNNGLSMGGRSIEIQSVRILDEFEVSKNVFKSGEMCIIDIEIIAHSPNITGSLSIAYYLNSRHLTISGSDTYSNAIDFHDLEQGQRIHVQFSQFLSIAPGFYDITVSVSDVISPENFKILHRKIGCVLFQVQSDKQILGYVNMNARCIIVK